MPSIVNLLFVFLVLVSCEHFEKVVDKVTETSSKAYKNYKHNMIFKVDGVSYDGFAVLPKQREYKINIDFDDRMERVTIASCHRHKVFWHRIRRINYTYLPSRYDEASGNCNLRIGAFDTKGQNSWGFIVLKTGEETAKGTLYCNGDVMPTEGVGYCESFTGTRQSLIIPAGIKSAVSSDGCEEIRLDPNMRYRAQITITSDLCTHLLDTEKVYIV